MSKLRAYQKALVSAEALVVSTRQSILGSEQVNLDALNAEQQLYSTRRDLAQARYDYRRWPGPNCTSTPAPWASRIWPGSTKSLCRASARQFYQRRR